MLDAKYAPKSRSAYAYLCSLAYTNNISKSRVDEVMDLTGPASVKKTKAGRFSLGMSQRLAIAASLLGDPKNLVLDEPVNGLDAEGVKWVRDLCRNCAAEGRAVLLSSHLMSEVALTADNLVIIGEGRILQTTTVSDFVEEHSRDLLSVVTPDAERMQAMSRLAERAHHGDHRGRRLPGGLAAHSESRRRFRRRRAWLRALADRRVPVHARAGLARTGIHGTHARACTVCERADDGGRCADSAEHANAEHAGAEHGNGGAR